MASLLALAKKWRTESAKTAPETVQPFGTITEFQVYPQLRYADVEGIGTVTIDQTGNMVGASPVERCTYRGETTWIPLELIRNIRLDPFVVPTEGKVGRPPKE